MKGKNAIYRYSLLVMLLVLMIILSLAFASSPIPDAAKPGYEAISTRNLQAFLKFIAADELEGRNTGDRGLDIAAKFLESQYTIAGLTPVPGQKDMLQRFDVVQSKTKDGSSVSFMHSDRETTQFKYLDDIIVLSRHREDINNKYAAVFTGFGYKDKITDHDDYENVDLAGKIMIALDGSPELAATDEKPIQYRRKLRALRKDKTEWAQKAGAAAVIYLNNDLTENTKNFIARFLKRPGQLLSVGDEPTPQILLTKAATNAILASQNLTYAQLMTAALAREKPDRSAFRGVTIELNIKTDFVHKKTQNVVAYLEGSDPVLKKEIVALGAHYDHVGMNENGEIYNGADDDGSGTVGILEIARAFAQNPQRPKRSLVFISHAGEEKGLLGSRFYTDRPLIPLENTVVQLNIDMIGRNDPNSVYIIGSNFLSHELHRINEEANKNVGLHFNYEYNSLKDPNRFYYRSDHYHYAKNNIPIIFYFSGTHEDYHKPTDTVEKIDFMKMQKITRLVYLTAWQIANRDDRLPLDGTLLQ